VVFKLAWAVALEAAAVVAICEVEPGAGTGLCATAHPSAGPGTRIHSAVTIGHPPGAPGNKCTVGTGIPQVSKKRFSAFRCNRPCHFIINFRRLRIGNNFISLYIEYTWRSIWMHL
jgi:hypothetical protein